MEYAGLIAIIFICGLFADGLLVRQKVKNRIERVERLEKTDGQATDGQAASASIE